MLLNIKRDCKSKSHYDARDRGGGMRESFGPNLHLVETHTLFSSSWSHRWIM